MSSFTADVLLDSCGTPKSRSNGFLRCSRWGWLILLVITLMASLGAMAQLSGKGAITGTVSDKTGAVIPGASVVALNTATGIKTTTTTTGAGDYNFSNLDPGIYTVTTSSKGFETQVQQNVHVNAMEMQTYSPILTVGGSSTEITVTAAPPQLETSNAVLGATMENEVYSELPIEMGAYGQTDQRRATDFAFLMPGVQGNNTNGNPTTNTGVVNGSGSRGAASAVYVDGVVFVRAGGNGDPRYVWTAVSVDAIDQFQVQTTGYSAVYEGQGVMNYTVKQGGSKQHGSVYEFIRNTSLDTWGFLAHAPNPITNVPVKPVEHSNEYGINLSGPLVPFGKWKEKVFYYGNYNGFRYTSATPTSMTFPTYAQQSGDFSATGNQPIYDPTSQAACTSHQTNGYPCRYQYGYKYSGSGTGATGNPVAITGQTANVIPTGPTGNNYQNWSGSSASEISPVTAAMQALLPKTGITSALQNNYIAPNATGLVNWSTTDRIDFLPTASDTLTFIFADGRQASSNPVGQTTAGRNVAQVPFNYGQTYAPKTAVGIIEETHIFTPHLINQTKWGYARYNGPTFNPATEPQYAPSKFGMSFANTTPNGLPVAGQALTTFPIVPFSGTNSPTGWGGSIANVTVAENYTAMDNLQWTVGKHSFTFGGQVAWLLYNTISATGGTTPMVLASGVNETSAFAATANNYNLSSGTGMAYASFLLGQIDSAAGKNASGSSFTYTDYSAHPGYGARFRPISPYIQDNWKITPKLTLDLGLRYDFFPSVREVKDDASYFDPNLANPLVGNLLGALNFTGHGTGTCNCDSPVKNYYRNLGPRLGAAYQLDSKTVIRSSWGVMYTHGDAVGGLASTLGTLGFSNAPPISAVNDSTAMTGLLNGSDIIPTSQTQTYSGTTGWTSGQIPAYAAPLGVASGPGYGTGYNGSNSSKPSGSNYDDPYLGGRAPEYINWTFGIQRQVTNALAVTATYVGSEGHFLQLDSNTARGFQSNQLDPKYLVLGSHLGDKGATVTTDCSPTGAVVTDGFSCNSTALANLNSSATLSTLLTPYPFEAPSDSFGYVGNANYHALQAIANMRSWRGLTVNASFTYGRAIDDAGTFRSGYAIPAGTIANQPTKSWKVDRIERSVSTSNQKIHFVATAVWDWPLGKTILNSDPYERAILGGFKFSGVYQQFSGSPLAITESSAQTNQAQTGAPAVLNPNFSGSARQNGRWGKGATYSNYNTVSYIVPSTGTSVATATGPFMNTSTTAIGSSYNYLFGDASRTAPYNLVGPGTYQVDLAMVRSFPLHLTPTTRLDFRAEWYNVTNHTFWSVASSAIGNSAFGTVTPSGSNNRKAAQFSARIAF